MQGTQSELMLMDFIWFQFYFDFISKFNVIDYIVFSIFVVTLTALVKGSRKTL
jgi:hypothetical protein